MSDQIKSPFLRLLKRRKLNISSKKKISDEIMLITPNPPGGESRNRELNESIVYAKRIQEGMMLKEKHLAKLFKESFLIFNPKDIVSGDFYWFTKLNDKIIIAVADCTGHGIPGAFMSVLGISLLNQIVIEEKNTDVSFILQRLDHKIKKAFSYSHELITEDRQMNDGMDISICSISPSEGILSFAGAFRPVYHVSENILTILEGSRYPIGGLNLEAKREYSKKTISYKTGDRLFMFSDGFADQFGGNRNKKFMAGKFRSLLLKTSRLSVSTQKDELERTFLEWRNNNEQTDDVLVVGVKL